MSTRALVQVAGATSLLHLCCTFAASSGSRTDGTLQEKTPKVEWCVDFGKRSVYSYVCKTNNILKKMVMT